MSTLLSGTIGGGSTRLASAILSGYSSPSAPGSSVRSALFANGEKGVWFDPSDLGTMFQDSAGTTPVTATGQPVGLWLDKSGNGFNATQATAANRPTLRQDSSGRYYLAFNGTNSWMVTGSINFTATDKMSVFSGVRKLSDAVQAMLVELGTGGQNGSIYIGAPVPALDTFRAQSQGTLTSSVVMSGYASPVTAVLASTGNISGKLTTLRTNTTNGTSSTVDQGTGNYGNYPLYIGARAGTSLFLNGNLYGLIVRGALSSASEIAATEAYMNSKTGAY